MVQYYTLEQAAQILRTTPDLLKEMAKRNEVRAFQDRGTLRFRAQEINELARLKGIGSDAELQLGEAAAGPKSPAPKSPSPGPKSGSGKPTTHAPADAGTPGADDSDEVPLGAEPAPGPAKSPGRSGGKPPSSKGPTKSPPPKAASDSDVRLVMDGGDLDFQIAIDSDVSVAKDPASGPAKTPGKKSRVQPPEKADSGVRIVPLEQSSDSDVKIDPGTDEEDALVQEKAKTPSDSDIRLEALEPAARPRDKGSDDALVTEEIDLDAEAHKAAEAGKAKPGKRPRSKVAPPLPTSSPFELSESDISVEAPKTPGKGPKSPGKAPKTPPKGPKTPEKKAKSPEDKEGETDSSSDFELTPLGESSSPLDAGSSGEVPIMTDDDEVSLGELTGAGGGSGINLREPVDSGISLEQGGSDEIDFELSLEAPRTPKPKPASEPAVDSSSEFELSLDADSSPVTGEESDSEFELSLDADSSPVTGEEADSSSEFELTLDEEGGLAPVGDSSPLAAEGEQDIFETDFEVPALDEESGSEAVALDEADTDLESSDFDLALNEEEASAAEGSESQVMALEDEAEADSGAATVARPRRAAAAAAGAAAAPAAADEGLAEIEEDLEGEPEEEEEAAVAAAPARAAEPAQWGMLPALVLFPCTIVLFVVGLMSFEMIQGLWGYHRGAKVSKLVIDPIARMFDETLPKD